MAKAKPKQQERRKKLGLDAKEHMFAVLIRNQDAFLSASESLTVEQLQEGFGTNVYALIWRVVTSFYAEFNELPPKDLLQTRIAMVLNEQPTILTDEEVEKIDDYVLSCFDPEVFGDGIDTSDTKCEWAIKTLMAFMHEVLLVRAAEQFGLDGKIPKMVPEVFEKLSADAQTISSLGGTGQVDEAFFGDNWEEQHRDVTRPSNVSIIEHFTGGEMAGEVVQIMGPYGSCKTTLAAMSMWQGCMRAAADWAMCGKKGKRPMAIYVSYETPKVEFQRRMLARAAEIPLSRLLSLKNYKLLRKKGEELIPYETQRFHYKIEADEPVESEHERARRVVAIMDAHMMYVDMTGKTPGREHVGKGGFAELQQTLYAEFRRRKDAKPDVIWIDHTADMADEFALETGMDDSQKVAFLRRLPKQLSKLGTHFGVTVYQIHQFSGEGNAKGPYAKLSLADAEGCKSLARAADFCLLIGKPSEDDRQLASMSAAKHRRRPPEKTIVIQIEGDYSTVRHATEYELNRGQRDFQLKSDTKTIKKKTAKKNNGTDVKMFPGMLDDEGVGG